MALARALPAIDVVGGEVVRLGVSPSGRPSVRLTSRVQTFLSLGAVLQVGALVAIGDHLVRAPRPELEGRSTPHATLEELRAKGVEVTGEPEDQGFGLVARIAVPHAGELMLYQPRYRPPFAADDVSTPPAGP